MPKPVKEHPLILVFYVDKATIAMPQIMQPFITSVNDIIAYKKMNAVAFFLPTRGEERVECINPIIAPEGEMAKIAKIVEEIRKHYGIGENLDESLKNINN